MIFILLNYAIFLFLLFYSFYILARKNESNYTDLIFYYCLAIAFSALGIGVALSIAGTSSQGVALFFIKITALMALGSHLLIFLLAITFPYKTSKGFLRNSILIIWIILSLIVLFSDNYLQSLSFDHGIIHFSHGPLYFPLSVGGFATGLISAVVLLVRYFSVSSRIFKLQTAIITFSILVGYSFTFFLGVFLPNFLNIEWVYPLMTLGAVLMALLLSYGVTLTRLVDIAEVGRSVLSFVLYLIVVGVITGSLYVLGSFFSASIGWGLLLPWGIGVYFVSHVLSSLLKSRFKTLLQGQRAYAEKLESELSRIDYAQGRDRVIDELAYILEKNIGCSSIHLFIEDNQEQLRLVKSISKETVTFEGNIPIKTPFIDLLLNNDISIIIKTEVVTNYNYHTVKADLLNLMDQFSADALILLRTGRDVIGLLLLGSKASGGDFLDYDFDALMRVYGKLFVTLYYLKNIAQESLVTTVDREIEFSEQIIASLQKNIDKITHPNADIAFITRSARKLGGDFIDFIRLSNDRYMGVMGDVSGRGLNASMSMIILKSMIRTFVKETKDFKALIIKINNFIRTYLPRGTYFSGLIGLFNFKDRTLFYVNCGVPVMYLLSVAYNNPFEIQGSPRVLGFVKDITPYINVRKVGFRPGDILMITTDGLTDAESLRGVKFGKERIQKSLLENRSASAERITQFLQQDVMDFVSQELYDDISILSVKFL